MNNKLAVSTEQIWEEFSHDLRLFIKSRLNDEDTVEDLIQVIFFKIHSNIDKLKDNSKLRSWIYQIARNAITDFFREEKKTQTMIGELKDKNDFNIDTAANEILYFCMDHFMSLLPVIYREAILFTEIAGHSQIELAKKEMITVSAAKSRVQRARIRLKELILEYSHIELDQQIVDTGSLIENCPFCKI